MKPVQELDRRAIGDGARAARARILPAAAPTQDVILDARALTGPDGLARVRLDDQIYSLRITRQGKLLLTK